VRRALLLLLLLAACATGGYSAPRPECATLFVRNHSWYDVVVRTSMRRLGDVTSQQSHRYKVCGHDGRPLAVQVDEVGVRRGYVVFGHGGWADGSHYTLEVGSYRSHSVLRVSWETER
jgi:hypothetical protein